MEFTPQRDVPGIIIAGLSKIGEGQACSAGLPLVLLVLPSEVRRWVGTGCWDYIFYGSVVFFDVLSFILYLFDLLLIALRRLLGARGQDITTINKFYAIGSNFIV